MRNYFILYIIFSLININYMSTKKCPNCDIELPETQFILHERFCAKFTRKCSICKEPVQKDEYEEHKKENHAKVNCDLCGKPFDKSVLEEHKGKCSKKLLNCAYCGLSLAKDEIKQHEYLCGGKTEECEFCKEMVPKMEYELHLQYTCKGIDRKANGMSSIKKEEDRTECCLCGSMVLVKDYDYHIERECKGVSSAEKKPQRYQNKTVDDILKESAFGIQDKIEKEEEVISISSDDDKGDNKKRKKR